MANKKQKVTIYWNTRHIKLEDIPEAVSYTHLNRPWSVVAVAGTHSPHFESDYWCVPEEVAVVALVEA